MKQTLFKLKNKMNVILAPSHKSPVVSVQMWVRTGSVDEKKGEEGISHFIEHLVFKGTDKYKVGEIAKTIEASGGELNAYTSFDQTVFYVTISKNYIDTAMDVISEMMGHPTFDSSEIDSEREVVCEEIKMGIDSPGRSASQLMFNSVFKHNSYGIPVIGYEKNVRSWSTKKIVKYFESRYVPSNMTLIISGDFDVPETKKKTIELFEQFRPLKLQKTKKQKSKLQKKTNFVQKYKDISESILQLAWPSVNVRHKDALALEVLAQVLGQSESSRLYKTLRLDLNLVNTISAYSYNATGVGLFAVSAKFTEEKLKEILYSVLNEIEKIKQLSITWEELKRTIISISSEQFYSIETVDGIASKIGSDIFYLNDIKASEKQLLRLQKIKPIDIQKVAKKYLKLITLNVSLLNSDKSKKSVELIQKTIKEWTQEQKNKKQKNTKLIDRKIALPKIKYTHKVNAAEEKLEIYKTKKGTEILFQKMTETPTVSAKIVFGGGSRLEKATHLGVNEMLGRIWPATTQTKTEEQLLKSIDDCAAGLNSFSGKNTTGLSIDYMKAFEKNMLSITTDVLLNPVFNQEIFNREMEVLKNQIISKQDNSSYLCGRQFLNMIFPNHVLSYEQSGDLETLKNVTTNDVETLYRKLYSKQNVQLSVVGDFDKKLWIELADKIEERFTGNGRLLEKIPPPILMENKSQFLKKDKEQSHIILGWQSLSLSDPRRYALEIIQAVLSGQGGRLFIELRDKNSLAYSVSPIKMESLESGYFGGYIACSPDKVQKSIEMFKQEFEKLMTTALSESELDRAKKYLIGQNDIGLQRKSSICSTLTFDRFYGNPIDDKLHLEKIYRDITANDVRELALDLFSKNHVTSIVGKE